jgi:hypothetical protein
MKEHKENTNSDNANLIISGTQNIKKKKKSP